MTQDRDRQVREMEERSKELGREIEETERDWERTQREVPSADDPKDRPLDEDNPVGGP